MDASYPAEAPGPLWIAAGGGGDALAAAVLHAHLQQGRPTIATFSWDRLLIDPLPGPRTVADFIGLEWLGDHPVVTATTRPRPPAGSTLPRLASEVPATFVLLDPAGGATGLHRQVASLLGTVTANRIEIIDVGGDILAEGHEDTLRSPLADALALAAGSHHLVPTRVLVTGAGLDGELPASSVLDRVLQLDGHHLTTLGSADARRYASVLDWHPSEAAALTLAAAQGHRGTVEIRDAGHLVELTAHSADVYEVDAARLYAASSVAQAVTDSNSLDQAEDAVRRICGRSELDHERSKARRMARHAHPRIDRLDIASALERYAPDARARGIDYLTVRRIAELSGYPGEALPAVHDYLAHVEPGRFETPLWSTAAA